MGSLVVSDSRMISPVAKPDGSFLPEQLFAQSIGYIAANDSTLGCVGSTASRTWQNTTITQSIIVQGDSINSFNTTINVINMRLLIARCEICPPGTYAVDHEGCYGEFDNVEETCKECPEDTDCVGGTSVMSHEG